MLGYELTGVYATDIPLKILMEGLQGARFSVDLGNQVETETSGDRGGKILTSHYRWHRG